MTTPTAWMSTTTPRPCNIAPERWFSDTAKDKKAAIQACHACPLLRPCRAYALATRPTHGVWGGLTAQALRPGPAPANPRRDSKVPVDCDSPTSFEQHRRRSETCEPCRAKHAARVEDSRRARLDREHANCGGSMIGYHAHVALGEKPCPMCRAANIERLAARRAAKRTQATARTRLNAA